MTKVAAPQAFGQEEIQIRHLTGISGGTKFQARRKGVVLTLNRGHHMPYSQTTRSDIVIDTSEAPWMEVAKKELGKDIREVQRYASFKMPLMKSLVENTPKGPTLLDWNKVNADIMKSYSKVVGPTVTSLTAADNPQIAAYLSQVRTDPALNAKGRSYELPAATETATGWMVTAWCAAFVNWCLKESGTVRLGYATAASWLRFGTPLASPVYGCITIIKPSHSTGSTTGHVAFWVGERGAKNVLLGGNQGDRVCEQGYPKSWVLGYRWPTRADATSNGWVIV
jgi:uncharacterized protein (TIGR02594 family)